jgi:hypothetical protein
MASRMLYRSVLLTFAPRSPAPIASDGLARFESTDLRALQKVAFRVFGQKIRAVRVLGTDPAALRFLLLRGPR